MLRRDEKVARELEGHKVPVRVLSGKPVLLFFWASWCGPCKMMAPIFEQACARLEPRVRLAKVDTDANQQLAMQYGIRGIPTLILFHKGAERARTSGASDLDSLVGWVQQHLT